MPKLTFYRQARLDGGIRTGLEWDDWRYLERFEEGPNEGEDDPLGAGLLWYVDLRCEGKGLPDSPDEGREWLVKHQEIIKEGLDRLADSIGAGVDRLDYPIRWSDFRGVPPDVSLTFVMSAMRRVDALRLAEVVRELGQHWEDDLARLERYVEAH